MYLCAVVAFGAIMYLESWSQCADNWRFQMMWRAWGCCMANNIETSQAEKNEFCFMYLMGGEL